MDTINPGLALIIGVVIAFLVVGWTLSRMPFFDRMIHPECKDVDTLSEFELDMLFLGFELHGNKVTFTSTEDATKFKEAAKNAELSGGITEKVHKMLCLCDQEIYDHCSHTRLTPAISQSPHAFGYAIAHGAILWDVAAELLEHFGETPAKYIRMADGLLEKVLAQISDMKHN